MRLRHIERWTIRRLHCVLCKVASERRVCGTCLAVRKER
jgi:hypothetical protein